MEKGLGGQEVLGRGRTRSAETLAAVAFTIPKIRLWRMQLIFLELGEMPGSVATPASLY